MNLHSDEEMLRIMKTDRELGFRRIYDRYGGPLLRFIVRFVGSQQIAVEILHDIFVELLEQNFRELKDGSLKNWLFTVAKNKSLNHLRQNKREVKSPQLIENAQTEDLETKMELRNLAQAVILLEPQLPKGIREVWDLRRQGMSYLTISQRLMIPVGTVKSRFHSLVNLLKEALDK